MNIMQKAQLFVTLLLLGQQASFTFNAGKHKYSVALAYTSEHQYLSMSAIISALESFAMGAGVLPYSATVGNVSITISLVS